MRSFMCLAGECQIKGLWVGVIFVQLQCFCFHKQLSNQICLAFAARVGFVALLMTTV